MHGFYTNGHVELIGQADWPEGTQLLVEPMTPEAVANAAEDMQANDPESIAKWLEWYGSLEPLEMTPEEEAAWHADRQAQKEFEKANFNKWADELRAMWE
jgi:hypothetical protein